MLKACASLQKRFASDNAQRVETQMTKTILVLNRKGGCGKTTLATNLAAGYAANGSNVCLFDQDAQRSSSLWAGMRSEAQADITLARSFDELSGMDHDVIVIDGPGGHISTKHLEQMVARSDVIVVPLLPASLDAQAGGQFITELVTNRLLRATPKPVAVVTNRVQLATTTHEQMLHLLHCLNVPHVAALRESSVYSKAIDQGSSVFEMKTNRAARKEVRAWYELVDWIDTAVASSAARLPLAHKVAPKVAPKAGTNADATSRRLPKAAQPAAVSTAAFENRNQA